MCQVVAACVSSAFFDQPEVVRQGIDSLYLSSIVACRSLDRINQIRDCSGAQELDGNPDDTEDDQSEQQVS